MNWIDRIKNNTEIKSVFGRDPILNDVGLAEFSIDYTNNTLTIDMVFFDWPTPLPEGWYVNERFGWGKGVPPFAILKMTRMRISFFSVVI